MSNVEVLKPASPDVDTIDLNQPSLFLNRALSLLEFHRRVLAQASDTRVPLLERLNFLCISTTSLDNFFEIRVAGYKQKVESGSIQTEPDNLSAQEVLNKVSTLTHELVGEQYRVLNEELFPELAEQQIRFIRRDEWSNSQSTWLREFYEGQLSPVLSPMVIDPSHPFPRIQNKSLNFIVSLKGKDAFGRQGGMAIVQAPRSLPRVIQLPPEEKGNGPHDFVFLSSIIHAYVDELFPGMKVNGCYQFRATRNSDLYVDEEEIDDLLRAMEGELAARRYGALVRLETADDCPQELSDYLLQQFQLNERFHYAVNGPVNLNRLSTIYDLVDRPDLKYPSFTPAIPEKLGSKQDIFDVIRKNDIMLHHPFDSFLPVIDLVSQAASDPNVVAIKQTLYRTDPQSAIVDALVKAAKAGKEVTVVVELRARFDEADNIALANRLQEAGAHLVYGVVGYKTHAKMMLIVRREGKKLRRYVHVSTGNYHPRTTRVYTDYGLMTCDDAIGEDVHQVFLTLTSLCKFKKLNKVLQAPFTLYDEIIKQIDYEIEQAKKGREARIIFKANGLGEKGIIQKLYEASMAGVKVDLIIRGICGLKPGIPDISDNIQVRSIVGRFLEHTRVYWFNNKGNPRIWCSSADLMDRNLFRRVELAFPIESRKAQESVYQALEFYLMDNIQAWLLRGDGTYIRASEVFGDEEPFSAQQQLLETLAEEY